MGMSGGGFNNRMEECRLIGNNVKGFNKMWEAGAIKVVLSRGFQIVRCVAEGNDGPGFWFDIDNRESLVEDCRAVENHGPGIMIEISETATIRGNTCLRNGLKEERGDWINAGILLAESMNCHVEGNVCVGNRTGIAIRQQEIRDIRPDPEWDRPSRAYYYSHGHTIRGNLCAFNREWQFALLGDNPFFADAADQRRVPKEDLARLNPAERDLQLEGNVYWPGENRRLLTWGVPWLPRHREYRDLGEFQSDTGLESGSQVADPRFRDWHRDDLTFLPGSPIPSLLPGVTGK